MSKVIFYKRLTICFGEGHCCREAARQECGGRWLAAAGSSQFLKVIIALFQK